MSVTTVAPGPSSSAMRIAAMTLAPDDVPPNNPSSRARRRAIAFASSLRARGLHHLENQLLGRSAALARHHRQLGAERPHLIQLLPAERGGCAELDPAPFAAADQRPRGSRAAAPALDERVPELESPVRVWLG